jgi:drug/metabolite transporter (DMT)-like permease
MSRRVSHLGAIGLALAAYTFWVFADTCLKIAGFSRLPGYEMLAITGFAEIVILTMYGLWRRSLRDLWPHRPGRQVMRSFLDLANNLCVVVAVRHIPLALFYILVFFAPMVTVLLAAVFLDEPLDLRRGLAVFAGFCGVVVAVHPSRAGWHPGYAVGYLACLVCVLCFSTNIVWSRVLTQAETPESMTFLSGVVTFAVGALLSLHHAEVFGPKLVLTLSATGLFGIGGSLCFFLALRHTATANVVQYHYTQLLTGAALAFAIWRERPTVWMWLGAVLIAAAGLYTASLSREPATRLAAAEPVSVASSVQ